MQVDFDSALKSDPNSMCQDQNFGSSSGGIEK
ncbi:MAG: hypothetical protein JWN25_182 [Verrucomicrobiales bacterium]|nr:hypothetical protein [Verrucomicrobiales bacterium]